MGNSPKMGKSNGSGWRYQCKICNYQVGIDTAFPKECPRCYATGWWGHLVTTGNNGKLSQKIEDGTSIKNPNETMPEGIKTRKRILSQLPDAVEQCEAQNNGIYEASQGRERGRPRLTVPGDLILELAGQGFSSRAMAARLNEQGITLSYKTIQRRLQAKV